MDLELPAVWLPEDYNELMSTQEETTATIQRLQSALNAHDIEAFVACFDPDYKSDQPAHPDRQFTGREQVKKNWSAIFEAMPDLQAEIVNLSTDTETAWVEWRWTATQGDGSPFDWRGVCLFGVKAQGIAWGRLYMEPVEQGGAGIDATVQEMHR